MIEERFDLYFTCNKIEKFGGGKVVVGKLQIFSKLFLRAVKCRMPRGTACNEWVENMFASVVSLFESEIIESFTGYEKENTVWSAELLN